ncbi:MAG: genetic competence negative regulator [Paenibacillaceae bacterium]
MKIERLSPDKIRIFLTFDDLVERGIQKDDIWREIPKVHDLFSEMMDQAYSELGFDATGPLAVEVFALPVQGMVIIVTRGKMSHQHLRADLDADTYDSDEEVYEMEVTLEQSDLISFVFTDFEYLLRAAKVIQPYVPDHGGALFSYKDKWYLQLEPNEMEDKDYNTLISVLSEFGDATSVTPAVLEEYGKIVIAENAVNILCAHF